MPHVFTIDGAAPRLLFAQGEEPEGDVPAFTYEELRQMTVRQQAEIHRLKRERWAWGALSMGTSLVSFIVGLMLRRRR